MHALNKSQASNFLPPKAEQLRGYLDRHRPTGPSRLFAWMPIIAILGAVLLMLVAEDGWLQLTPFIVLLALFAIMAYRSRWLRLLEAQVTRVHELAMLRHYPRAMRLTWQLLPKLASMPPLHNRVVAFLADLLNQVRAYDAAIVAYDYLIHHLPAEHPAALYVQMHRVMAQLANDQLADADDALRNLRRHGDALRQPVAAATWRLAQLLQQVRTNHFTDAVESAPQLVAALRPLGVEAGYGHALMAYCYHMLAPGGDAMPWWSRATLLLPAEVLVERFPELGALAGQYTASQAAPPQCKPDTSGKAIGPHYPGQTPRTDARGE